MRADDSKWSSLHGWQRGEPLLWRGEVPVRDERWLERVQRAALGRRPPAATAFGIAWATLRRRGVDKGDSDPPGARVVPAPAGATSKGAALKALCPRLCPLCFPGPHFRNYDHGSVAIHPVVFRRSVLGQAAEAWILSPCPASAFAPFGAQSLGE